MLSPILRNCKCFKIRSKLDLTAFFNGLLSLVVPQILRQRRRGKALHELPAILRKIPPELYDLYGTIIQSLSKEDLPRSVRLLQWICFARRPLTLGELRCAMNVDTGSPHCLIHESRDLPSYIGTDKQMEKQLQGLSGGFAETKPYQDVTVAQLIHQSVSDYLVIKGSRSTNSSLSSIDKTIGYANVQLSTTSSCLHRAFYTPPWMRSCSH
jgi:hypothetical protein